MATPEEIKRIARMIKEDIDGTEVSGLYRIRDLSDGSILALVTFNPGNIKIPKMSIEVDQAEGDLETETAYSPDADVLNTPDELAGWLKLVSGMGEDVEGISTEVTMPRIILVDERSSHSYAIPFDSKEAVLLPYKKMVVDVMKRYYGFNDGDPELENVKAAKTIEDVGEWSEVLVLEEGEEGVWTGFSSADRNSIGGKLPLKKGEWTGNGDPHFYLTVGKPTGAIVPWIEQTEPEEDEEEEIQDQEV